MFQSLKLRVMVCLKNANKSLQYTQVLSLAFIMHKPRATVVVWRPMAAIAPIWVQTSMKVHPICTRRTPLKISNGLSALSHDPHSSQSPIYGDKRTSLPLLPLITSDFSRKQQWDKWKWGLHRTSAGHWWALEPDLDC